MMTLRKFEKKEKVITIRPGRHFWLADWSACPGAKHIRMVTGSPVVPIPYGVNVPARVVCREYAGLNPGYVVLFMEGGQNESPSL